MILRRLGNKQAIAAEIQKYFPPHKIYIEPFFGAGGMFFNKQKVNCNIVNDLDSDVSNLFNVLIDRKQELISSLIIMPKHQDLLENWKKNEETEPIKKALRFLFLSNYTYLGKGDSLKLNSRNDIECINSEINSLNDKLYAVQFANMDFRKFINSISIEEQEVEKTFIYADPPYQNTGDNYSNSFTQQDSIDLFDTLQKTGCKWAMSEFDNEFILNQAKERNLNVHIIGERQNLKNRRTEILITNYAQHKTLFD